MGLIRRKRNQAFDDPDSPYLDICGLWFSRLLTCNPPNEDTSSNLLDEEECLKLLGVAEDDPSLRSPTKHDRNSRLVLKRHIKAKLKGNGVNLTGTPLHQNISVLAETLNLNEIETQVVALGILLNSFRPFRNAISMLSLSASAQCYAKLIAFMLDAPHGLVKKAIALDGNLAQSGLLRLTGGDHDIERIFKMPPDFEEIMLETYSGKNELLARFFKTSTPAKLTSADFPHLDTHYKLLHQYLAKCLSVGEKGVNILLYGEPGVGKTEFAKLLTKDMEFTLYEVDCGDQDGESINGESRLANYMLCQRLLANDRGSLVLFDEIEDVFPSSMGGFFGMLFGGEKDNAAGKAWINRTLESNAVPAIWITNSIHQIDPAYLRRFDYALEFTRPPKPVRRRIIDKYLGELGLPEPFIERLANWGDISPAQLEKAARVAKLSSHGNVDEAQKISEQVLRGSAKVMQQPPPPSFKTSATAYSLDYLNTDMDIGQVVESLKHRPRGTFLFHGAPGTGKTALARHLAEAIGRPLMVKRGSDLLSMWVGGSEQNIAAMFREAIDENAVLVLDEADGLLADRRGAQRNWEVTQVNEMLTHMEDFQGIFICTTNLLDRLDAASLRRFAFKVRFDYLHPDQRKEFFLSFWKTLSPQASELERHDGARLERMDVLTPGDFAAVARRWEIIGTVPKADDLLTALEEECRVKGVFSQPMGFLA